MTTPSVSRPQVAVLAGINGAGKTTASQHILRDAMRIPSFTNADTIARGLNAFDVESVAAKAGRVMLDHLHGLAAARQSFAFETTLSGRAYARWLGELTRDGYTVHLLYYWLDSPELAIGRGAGARGWAPRPRRHRPKAVCPQRAQFSGAVSTCGNDVAGV